VGGLLIALVLGLIGVAVPFFPRFLCAVDRCPVFITVSPVHGDIADIGFLRGREEYQPPVRSAGDVRFAAAYGRGLVSVGDGGRPARRIGLCGSSASRGSPIRQTGKIIHKDKSGRIYLNIFNDNRGECYGQ
jgi:hypothetical protein